MPAARSARILDVSPHGLRLETSAPLERGGVYDLLLRLDDHRMPVAARVLRVKRRGELVEASLVFERVLESDQRFLEESLVREVAERMTVVVR